MARNFLRRSSLSRYTDSAESTLSSLFRVLQGNTHQWLAMIPSTRVRNSLKKQGFEINKEESF